MDARAFFNLTAEVREAQKKYFQLRRDKTSGLQVNDAELKAAMLDSIFKESALDKEITRVQTIIKQKNL